jgi:hypothetical protein
MSAKHRPSRKPPARDQDASPFAVILGQLVARVPGAYAASLVDSEGECVDYAGVVDPYLVKVAAAHLRILLTECRNLDFWGDPRSIIIRGRLRSAILHAMPDGYAVTLLLRRGGGFVPSTRAFAVCARALAKEAQWPLPTEQKRWVAAHVDCDERGRPVSVLDHDGKHAVEVLGTVVGLSSRERGFRVRTQAGNEITLVREPGWQWYADDPPAGPTSSR